MAQVPKPNQLTDLSSTKAQDVPLSDISIDRLMDDCLQALYREVKNLLIHSAKGKLPGPEARDLRDTYKLLFELKKMEADLLKGLTDEQLKAKALGNVDE